jgi:hypothetical protein
MGEANNGEGKMKSKHHIAAYNNKAVIMDYISDKKREFSAACMRIVDNAADGYVLTPKGDVYAVVRGKKLAAILCGDEKAQAMAIFNAHLAAA